MTAYEVLGVSTSATAAEIKRARNAQMRKYHPDVCKLPNAEWHTKRINAAYDSLIKGTRFTDSPQPKASAPPPPAPQKTPQKPKAWYDKKVSKDRYWTEEENKLLFEAFTNAAWTYLRFVV